jgi:predicted dehydrogenase
LGENVAVIGLGLLGLLASSIAQAAGCNVLGIDIKPRQIDLAASLGIEAVLRDDAEAASVAFSDGAGFDAVLICADTASSDPIELAGEIARDKARVIASGAVGLQVPRKVYYEKELTLINSRSYGPGRYDPSYEEDGLDYPIGYVRWTEGRNLQAFVKLLATGKVNVKPLVTHKFPVENAPEAYKLITEPNEEEVVAVLLTYPESEENINVINPKKIDAKDFSLIGAVAQSPDSVKLGVLGAGNFATVVMLPALSQIEKINLIGIASQSGANAQYAATHFKFQYAASDENRIIEDSTVNTVAILTRHNLHARQVLASLAAGKHTFCEKPLAITEEELDDIEAIIKATDGEADFPYLMVGFNRRFAPLSQKLVAFIGERKEPFFAHYRINAGYLPKNHWTQDPNRGGGRIIGESCHFIDFLTFLADAPPVSVFAQTLPNLGHYNNDNAVMTFTFPDSSIGVVSYLANGDKAFPKERVEVFSGGRIAVLDDFRKLETIFDGKKKVHKSRTKQDKGHKAEWEALATAICGGGEHDGSVPGG